MFQILREDAVALCEGYGLLMASSWNRDRLTKKTAEMGRLIRSDEYVGWDDLDEKIQKIGLALSKAGDFEVVQKIRRQEEKEESEASGIVEDDEPVEQEEKVVEDSGVAENDEDEEEEEEEEDDDDDEEECILKVGQRVQVNDEEPWKGTISSILNSRYVEVEDRKGETWEVGVEKCEVLKQKTKGNVSQDDDEIRQLQEQIRKVKKEKGKKSAKEGSKRVTRHESVYQALERMEGPLRLKEIAEIADGLFVDGGGDSKLSNSEDYSRRVVDVLVRFGILKMVGEQIAKA